MQERGLKVINGSDIQKEIDNDPELFKLDSIEENSRLHVLKQWKPQTDKYVSGIKSSLDKLLSMDKAKPVVKEQKPGISKINFDNDMDLLKAIRGYVNSNYNTEYYDKTLIKERDKYLNKMSSDVNYSLENYKGGAYVEINNYLRGDFSVEMEFRLFAAEILDNDSNYKLRKDGVCFRGEHYEAFPDYVEKLAVGETFNASGMFSTSADVETASGFALTDAMHISSVIYKVNIKKNTKIGFGTVWEKELILRHGQKFIVNSIQDLVYEDVTKRIIEITTLE